MTDNSFIARVQSNTKYEKNALKRISTHVEKVTNNQGKVHSPLEEQIKPSTLSVCKKVVFSQPVLIIAVHKEHNL